MLYTLRGKIANIKPFTLDATLTVPGASAEAKAVGDAIARAEVRATELLKQHEQSKSNPHNVTAEQVGLGNVDNTSDLDKPVSKAQAEAISKAAGQAKNEAIQVAEDAQTAANEAKKTANEAKNTAETAQAAVDATNNHLTEIARRTFTVSLPTGGWSETAPYTKTLFVQGLKETDMPHWAVVYSDTVATALAEKEAFAMIDVLEAENDNATFICFEETPKMGLTIQLEVNR